MRRPVEEADRAVIGWLTRNVLDEEVMADVLKQVRRRLRDQSTKTSVEIPRLHEERMKLSREVDRLAEGIAVAPNVKVLATKLRERQDRLTELDARIQLLRSAPGVLDMEVRPTGDGDPRAARQPPRRDARAARSSARSSSTG